MAITNKLITFNKLTSFETQLAQGNILETSIVFIKDAKKIWTKGTYFDCSGGGSNNIAVYETTDDVYNGVLNDTYELSYSILHNENIHTVIIIQKMEVNTTTNVRTFVFNVCDRREPGITTTFTCLYSEADARGNTTNLIFYQIAKTEGEGIKLNKQPIALKSDIPDTSSFASSSDMQEAQTRILLLQNDMSKKQNRFKINGRTINLDEDIEVAELDLGANGRYTMADGMVDAEDNYYSLPSNPDNYGDANILATKADVNAKKDTRNLTYSLNNSTSGTVTLLPNVCIYMPNVLTGKLAINACSTISSNNADLIESRICFRMPNNAIMPAIQFNGVAIRWAGGNAPTFEADFTYEVSLFYPSNANSVGPMGVCVGFK